jgi:hypothetical protein
MNQTKTLYFVFLITCIVLLPGCERKASDEVDFGTFENSVYQNKYFGLTLTVPSEWSIQDQESQKQMMDTAKKLISGEDKNLEKTIKASEWQVVNLLALFKHPRGTPVPFNPSFICIAERVSHLPGIKEGKDYLFHSKTLLESGQLDISFPRDISSEKLSGTSFDVMYVNTTLAGITIQQKMYATVTKGYALIFTISFITEEEKASLQGILESVAFEQQSR